MNKVILWLLASCFLLFSCHEAQHPDKEIASVHLGTFKGVPPTINGCFCYFSKNDNDFQNELYIFASDLDSNAYININNHQIHLKLIKSNRNDTLDNIHNFQEIFSDGIYQIIINDHVQQNHGEEVWWNTGTIQLFFKKTEIETLNFMGECGC